MVLPDSFSSILSVTKAVSPRGCTASDRMMEQGYLSDNQIYTSTVPASSDATYGTSFSRSRRVSDRISSLSIPSTAPQLNLDFKGQQPGSQDADEFSLLDPEHLTPNLHASLVSEILTLRRELESKNGFIERLEANYSSMKNENETLADKLAKNAKESRTVKRQLQAIEESTLTAIEDLVRERDETKRANADLKRRHELSSKKVKAQDDIAEQMQAMWERDKQKWDDEKKVLERKAHVSESRLRTIVEELQTQEAAVLATNGDDAPHAAPSAVDSDTASISSPKMVRGHTRKRSGSVPVDPTSASPRVTMTGVSLADELMDGEDDGDELEDDEEVPDAGSARAVDSRQSIRQRVTTPTMQTTDHASSITDSAAAPSTPPSSFSNPGTPAAAARELSRTSKYVDTGIQFTPPASPSISPIAASDASFVTTAEQGLPEPSDLALDSLAETYDGEVHTALAVSGLPTPPLTLVDGSDPIITQQGTEGENPTESASSTPRVNIDAFEIPPQPTNAPPPPPPSRAPPPAPATASATEVYDSESKLTTPRASIMKVPYCSIGCQTDDLATLPPAESLDGRSVGMQTEAIRLDKRLKMPHLLPSALPLSTASRSGKDLSPVPENSPNSVVRKLRRQPQARESSPTPPPSAGLPHEDVFSENDADELAEALRYTRPGKPLKVHPKSAGSNVFDYDGFDDLGDLDLSDGDDYGVPVRAARRGRRPSRTSLTDATSAVPEDQKLGHRANHRSRGSNGSRVSIDRSVKSSKSYAFSQASRPADPRRPLHSSKHGASLPFSRTPSMASLASSSFSKVSGPPPPFAIPARRSSVGVPTAKSDGSVSPTAYKGGASSIRSRRSRQSARPSIRKSFSTTSLVDDAESSRRRSRDLDYIAVSVPGSGGVPPLPAVDISQYHGGTATIKRQSSGSRPRQYSQVTPTGNASVGASIQNTVLDSITATMIGEWMWKYVRKRTSFGMSDGTQDFARNGDARHKRWVWLSPSKRTVMWSAKQPTSNIALLGKNGRKFAIQSVLDIKDDSPRPRGATAAEVFHRSILVLTPNRALKFTATTLERHYLWLTALSFLAQNATTGLHDLAQPPPPLPSVHAPSGNAQSEASGSKNSSALQSRAPSVRRGMIRDSIRIAREKSSLTRPRSALAQNAVPRAGSSGYSSPVPPQPVTTAPFRQQTLFALSTDISDAAAPPSVPRTRGGQQNPLLTLHNQFAPPTSRFRRRGATPGRPPYLGRFHSAPTMGAVPSSIQSSQISTTNVTASSSTADLRALNSTTTVTIPPSISSPHPSGASSSTPFEPVHQHNSSADAAAFPMTVAGVNVGSAPPPGASAVAGFLAGSRTSVIAEESEENESRMSDTASIVFGSNSNFFDAVKASPSLHARRGDGHIPTVPLIPTRLGSLMGTTSGTATPVASR